MKKLKKVINIKEKSEKEILEGYSEMAKQVMAVKEIWDECKDLDKTKKIYEKIRVKTEKNDSDK